MPYLSDLGVTLIEVMPIGSFNGRFGWGYDGVNLFAPFQMYGRPDDVRRFVNRAHECGLGVILDVVWNHFGPVGNYLSAYSSSYFTKRYENEWGEAINFDGPDSEPVRQMFIANGGYWIDEFHLDGLRLDATQQIFDKSPEHILAAAGKRAREAAGQRSIVLIAENENQESRFVRPLAQGGYGLDGLWNDDFHHSAMVALTGRADAYYSDTRGDPQEIISAAKYGFLFQGQCYSWQGKRRGTPAWGLPPSAFVGYLQNHDQIANSARGLRGHQITSPGMWRAMTAVLLLGPWTPLMFQGQELEVSSPFLFFADFEGEIGAAVRKGRGEFLSQFASVREFVTKSSLDDPCDPATFERCKLDPRSRDTTGHAYALHFDLLRIRRDEAAFSQRPGGVDGTVLERTAFALRFFTPDHRDDRVLLVNLGSDLTRSSIAEPLLAPPDGATWTLRWSSEDPRYGGSGTPELWKDDDWRVPGQCAILLAPTG